MCAMLSASGRDARHHLETMTVTTEHLNRVTEFAKAQRLSTQEAISTMILLLHARFGYSLEAEDGALTDAVAAVVKGATQREACMSSK